MPVSLLWAFLLVVGASGMNAPDSLFQRADSLFRAGSGETALSLVLEAAEAGHRPYESLWRGASYAVGLGIVEEAETGESGRFAQALALARRARKRPGDSGGEDADGLEARYWEVAALGRLALAAGRRERARYAEGLRDRAQEILDRDPDHAGAHHALGVLYLEIMKLPGLSRLVGRALLDADIFSEADWEEAERHLTRAVELEPGSLLFRLDLGRLHWERGREAAARRLLEQVAAARPEAPPEKVFRDEARALLAGPT